jgi:hypothetical protein
MLELQAEQRRETQWQGMVFMSSVGKGVEHNGSGKLQNPAEKGHHYACRW